MGTRTTNVTKLEGLIIQLLQNRAARTECWGKKMKIGGRVVRKATGIEVTKEGESWGRDDDKLVHRVGSRSLRPSRRSLFDSTASVGAAVNELRHHSTPGRNSCEETLLFYLLRLETLLLPPSRSLLPKITKLYPLYIYSEIFLSQHKGIFISLKLCGYHYQYCLFSCVHINIFLMIFINVTLTKDVCVTYVYIWNFKYHSKYDLRLLITFILFFFVTW